ncbi:MAG: hypothetical protein U9Q67_00225 [Patescibacteria group bacterium]|nr:hypothetical protein [Patescibacteria group bacterium]
MKKAIIVLTSVTAILIVVVGSIAVSIIYNQNKDNTSSGNDYQDKEESDTAPDGQDSVAEASNDNDELAPDPTEEDVIRLFFSLIDEDRPDEAVLMMSDNMVGTDPVQMNSTMQAYAVTFNEWNSVQTLEVEEYDRENWSMNSRVYKVTVAIEFKENPEYNLNWDDGENTRWIRILRTEQGWQIDNIATGP